jgi:hypothetical protein
MIMKSVALYLLIVGRPPSVAATLALGDLWQARASAVLQLSIEGGGIGETLRRVCGDTRLMPGDPKLF